MTQTFTAYAPEHSQARRLVHSLSALKEDTVAYQEHLQELGQELAHSLLPSLESNPTELVCVVCAVEDADFLARGVVAALAAAGWKDKTRFMCMWNTRATMGEDAIPELAPIFRVYAEDVRPDKTTFVVVTRLDTGGAILRTNLTRALSRPPNTPQMRPARVVIAAPRMLAGANDTLAREFPADLVERMEHLHFVATSDENDAHAQERSGALFLVFDASYPKNRCVPAIVRQRRLLHFPAQQ